MSWHIYNVNMVGKKEFGAGRRLGMLWEEGWNQKDGIIVTKQRGEMVDSNVW